MPRLIKYVRLNGLQYNANRDPQAYRRAVGAPFRIEARLGADARCTLRDAQGEIFATAEVPADGTFAHALSFDQPGVHVVTLTAERGGESIAQDLRLDVLAHAWAG
jgi:hypothetical protein